MFNQDFEQVGSNTTRLMIMTKRSPKYLSNICVRWLIVFARLPTESPAKSWRSAADKVHSYQYFATELSDRKAIGFDPSWRGDEPDIYREYFTRIPRAE